jgi:hypothetical protein
MQKDSLEFGDAELKDNSDTGFALQSIPELIDTDMIDAVAEEFRAGNSLIISKGNHIHSPWDVNLDEVEVICYAHWPPGTNAPD